MPEESILVELAPSRALIGAMLFCFAIAQATPAQSTNTSLATQVQQLSAAVQRAQAALEQSQQELLNLRMQLEAVQQQMANADANAETTSEAQRLAAQVGQMREQQILEQSQIATHEQTKVESASKYPLRLSGLILANGFVNTKNVDMADTPTMAYPGPGTTGASLRQSVVGLDVRGPHLFGARSLADLRLDFAGGDGTYNNIGAVRLRTAHASLEWKSSKVFFALDRSILNPNSINSLTAVAVPPLAWSGNLWSWNPQIGVAHDVPLTSSERLRLQAALIDVGNPPAFPDTPYPGSTTATNGTSLPSTAERSRWPGVETRFSILGATEDHAMQLGVGGFFAPHRTLSGSRFDSWAATLDYRQPLPAGLQLSGSFYRGLGLGGLGGGAYKDSAFISSLEYPTVYYVRPLDDIGGWAQLKKRAGERLELNAAYGIDNVPAGQLRRYAGPPTAYYQNLDRNQTFTGNVIYSPSAYVLFSLEYRHLMSSPVSSPTIGGNVIGLGAGYKF